MCQTDSYVFIIVTYCFKTPKIGLCVFCPLLFFNFILFSRLSDSHENIMITSEMLANVYYIKNLYRLRNFQERDLNHIIAKLKLLISAIYERVALATMTSHSGSQQRVRSSSSTVGFNDRRCVLFTRESKTQRFSFWEFFEFRMRLKTLWLAVWWCRFISELFLF